MADTDRLAATPVQKVVVVDGNAEVLGMLEAVLDAGRYDMVFVESSDHAYSQIKKVLPNLVIVCARIEQLESFQLLTMLKLDAETRRHPRADLHHRVRGTGARRRHRPDGGRGGRVPPEPTAGRASHELMPDALEPTLIAEDAS